MGSSVVLSVAVVLAVLIFCSSSVDGHMYLRNPVSRGGLNNNGGTTGPCDGLTADEGDVTTFEVGEQVTFQFRVNQHGPAPFAFNLSLSGENYDISLASNIANTVTAGPDGYNGVNVPITIPNHVCSACSIQLSGMGQLDGSGKWFNCANIKIVAAGSNVGPQVKSIFPTGGPTTGGTQVTVTGVSFGSSAPKAPSQALCRFDQAIVSATWVSATSITCNSPERNQATPAILEVSVDNGKTFSSSGVTYLYTGDDILPVVYSISPSYGLVNTTIVITGANFFSPGIDCKIGNLTVHGGWISETQVNCTIPANIALNGSASATISVAVRVDGSDYSQDVRSFTVLTPTAVTAMIAGIVVGTILLVVAVVAGITLFVVKRGSYGSEPVPSTWQKGRV